MGNTISLWLNGSSRPVHPHMHGEYTYSASLKPRLTGSPPHAWGIPTLPIRNNSVTRFTPTCMGNTLEIFSERTCSSVHPHMHGEYGHQGRVKLACRGSPPHAWGIPDIVVGWVAFMRFTPTCMGNTLARLAALLLLVVHPHMHGEYAKDQNEAWEADGSPPHAWGILESLVCFIVVLRFTPTCMGNTWWS